MTKNVRIENADTCLPSIVVYSEGLGDDGKWHRLSAGVVLPNPTDQHVGLVYAEQRLVVEEVPL